MANVYKPLAERGTSKYSIFLAGSIGVDKPAKQWQEQISLKLMKYDDLDIYNPRRDDWDSSWKQDPTEGTQFYDQVMWEQTNINKCDIIAFYFDTDTQSPITLLELGLCLTGSKKIFVMCPENFFRYGNVVLTCSLHGVTVYTNEDEWIEEIYNYLDSITICAKEENDVWCVNESEDKEDKEDLSEKLIENIEIENENPIRIVTLIQQPLNEETKSRLKERYFKSGE